jgi:3-phosphoshikimate 1-carboxyvinyltransferase
LSPPLRLEPARAIRGRVAVPGDKSISHRALLLAAVADADSVIRGRAQGGDQESMVRCLRVLGAGVEDRPGQTVVRGVGLRGLRNPGAQLDCGNSGATMRFLAGLLAGIPGIDAVLSGDASLSRRPMERVAKPLRSMGAEVETSRTGSPPVAIHGRQLHGVGHHLPMASAQVKTAILLAGLNASGETSIFGRNTGRDHTERLLRRLGVDVDVSDPIRLRPPETIPGFDLTVPGDPSSAAFWLVLGVVHPDAEVITAGVAVNATRTGFLDVLGRMGADIDIADRSDSGGEPMATLSARTSALRAVEIEPSEVPALLDEIPILAVAAACAEGTSVFRGLGELRVKEVDRVAAVAGELGRMGATIAVEGDDLVIKGGGRLSGAPVDSRGDHRIAMSLAVAAMIATGDTEVSGAEAASVSYPGFFEVLSDLQKASPG